jgi:hypothetical protein
MRYAIVLSALLLLFSTGPTDAAAQEVESTVGYTDGNLSVVATMPGVPFDSTLFVFWYLEVDDPANPDHDIFIHQIGTFKEFEAAYRLDFIDIHADGSFHFDAYASDDGVNFYFVDEVLLAGP